MQTCTFFATFTNYLSRELENTDPDLSGTEKPSQMTKAQWNKHQADKTRRLNASANSSQQPEELSEAARNEKIAKLFEIIKKYEVNFSRHLQILLDALNHYAATETVVLLGLCARLSTANQGTQYSGLRADEDENNQG